MLCLPFGSFVSFKLHPTIFICISICNISMQGTLQCSSLSLKNTLLDYQIETQQSKMSFHLGSQAQKSF